MKKPLIGFIGQGWIGKNYADDFERRGFSVVRFALEEPYIKNIDKIKECDIVFIAVPTPSTPKGFDSSILEKAIKNVGKGKIVVIKSTLLPGTTQNLQQKNKEKFLFHSPEFLTEATAAHDAANPKRNIIGMAKDNKIYRTKAKLILDILPKASFTLVCKAEEAEFIKYAGNNWFYLKVVFVNVLYDLARASDLDYEVVRKGMAADTRIGPSHLLPMHQSGTVGSDNFHLVNNKNNNKKQSKVSGRGAGGHCFIKDYAAFIELHQKLLPKDKLGRAMLKSIEQKNVDLLLSSNKDLDLLEGVYGSKILKKK